MLLLGEEVAQLYKNIEHELTKPAEDTALVNYKPVMKKRVYNLNSGYLSETSALSPQPNSQTLTVKAFRPEEQGLADYYRNTGEFNWLIGFF